MRGPGVKSNETSKDVVINIDLAPTIVEMGGGKLNSVDGISFLSSIMANETIRNYEDSLNIRSKHIGK